MKIFVLTYCLISITAFSFSQSQDVESWTALKLEKKLNDKITIINENEIRMINNISAIEKYFFELGAEYKLSDFIRLRAIYRHARTNEQNYYGNLNRLCGEIILAYNISNFKIRFRNRFQTQYSNIYNEESWFVPQNKIRSKLKIAYDFDYSPFEANIYYEIFYQLTPYSDRDFNKTRISPGIKYRLNKRMDLNVFYILEKEYNVSDPLTAHIFGLGLAYKL